MPAQSAHVRYLITALAKHASQQITVADIYVMRACWGTLLIIQIVSYLLSTLSTFEFKSEFVDHQNYHQVSDTRATIVNSVCLVIMVIQMN